MRSIFILALLLESQLLVQALPVHRRSDNAATTPDVATIDTYDPDGLMGMIEKLQRTNKSSAGQFRRNLDKIQEMAKTDLRDAQYAELHMAVMGKLSAAGAPITQNFREPRGKKRIEASSSDPAPASSSGTRKKQKNIGPEHGVPSQLSTSQAPSTSTSHPPSARPRQRTGRKSKKKNIGPEDGSPEHGVPPQPSTSQAPSTSSQVLSSSSQAPAQSFLD